MRIIKPTITSQKIEFSQQFQNLTYVNGSGGQITGTISVNNGLDLSGGGYLRYSSYGAENVWNLATWSIFAKVVVPSIGSARTIITCGESSTDCYEIGIDSSNKMQMIGATIVSSDVAVTAGVHNLLFIYNGTNIQFYSDGNRIGTSAVSLGTGELPFVYIGAASDGSSRKWGDIVHSIDVYKYALGEDEAFQVSRSISVSVEGWTPKDLLNSYGGTYTDGLYFDGNIDGSYELNTQPTLLDGNMEAVGVTDWLSNNATLTKVVGSPGGTGLGSQVLRVSFTGVGAYAYQSILTIGNRYQTTGYARSQDGIGAPFVGLGTTGNSWAGTTSTTWQVVSGDETCPSTNRFRPSNAGGGVTEWDNLLVKNLSCTKLNLYTSGTLAGSKFEQTLADKMPWKDSNGTGIKFDGAVDRMTSTFAASTWKWLHGSGGATIAGYFLGINSGTMLSSLRILATRIGVELTWSSATGLNIRLGNGSGVYVIETAVAAPAGGFVYLIRYDSSGYNVRINGVLVDSGPIVGSFSSADPYAALDIGSASGTSFVEGSMKYLAMYNGAISDLECNMLESYLMRSI